MRVQAILSSAVNAFSSKISKCIVSTPCGMLLQHDERQFKMHSYTQLWSCQVQTSRTSCSSEGSCRHCLTLVSQRQSDRPESCSKDPSSPNRNSSWVAPENRNKLLGYLQSLCNLKGIYRPGQSWDWVLELQQQRAQHLPTTASVELVRLERPLALGLLERCEERPPHLHSNPRQHARSRSAIRRPSPEILFFAIVNRVKITSKRIIRENPSLHPAHLVPVLSNKNTTSCFKIWNSGSVSQKRFVGIFLLLRMLCIKVSTSDRVLEYSQKISALEYEIRESNICREYTLTVLSENS